LHDVEKEKRFLMAFPLNALCVELCSFPPWGRLFRKSERLTVPRYLHFNILLNDHLVLPTQYNRSQLWDSLKTRRGKSTEGWISFFRT